jgi:membrane protein implicated in regulation of membrane protease activity
MVAAIAFFGVSGEAALSAGYATSTAFILAMIAGAFAMYGMYRLMRLLSSLDSSGNERIGNAVGRRATVYLRIPATRSGAGKVQLSMQNRIVEYQAFTDESETLQSGESVEVVDVAGGDTVYVRRIAQPIPRQEAVSS